MSSRLACVLMLLLGSGGVATLGAQPNSIFNGAPPDVDSALRKRITAFFEAHQQGKWRQAEKFVAEDSIDAFLERDKNRYSKFEIREIRWVGQDFKEATVLMIVPFEMSVLGVGTIDGGAPLPITHHWKFEDGDWYWFSPKVDPCAVIESPVGPITPECKDGKPVNPMGPQADAQKALQRMVDSASVKPEMLQNRVTASASQLQFDTAKASEQTVTIDNAFDGPVTLELIGGKIVGLKIAFDGAPPETPGRLILATKKSATLRFQFQPSDNRPPDRVGIQVRVDPLNVMLPINLLFSGK